MEKRRRTTPTNKQVPVAESGNYRKNLTEMQERVAELAADLIMNGGEDDDVKLLLYAVIRHQWRRRFPEWERPSDYRVTSPEEVADKRYQDWFKDLAREWPKRPVAPEDPKPETVKEIIRANVRGDLRREFDEFMESSEGLTDVYLLRDIFIDWRCTENELGQSFSRMLGQQHTYVMVPWKHETKFRKFADLLSENES